MDTENSPLNSQLQMTVRERREIRHMYRDLLDQTEQNDEEPKDLDALTSALIQVEAIFEKQAQLPREAALDAKVVSHLSTVGANIAQSLDTNVVTFHPTEFAERLANYISPTEHKIGDWSEFGKNVACFFKRAPSFDFMYGSFKTDPPEKPEKASAKRNSNLLKVTGEKKAPEKVAAMGKSDQEATTAEVDRILGILKYLCTRHGGPLCFFEFAVDPDSFAQTVLNVFHITFLIKDGFARVFLDHDGLPVIETISEEESAAAHSTSRRPVTNEVVMSMNKAEWREIVKEFKIERATIPPSRTFPGASQK